MAAAFLAAGLAGLALAFAAPAQAAPDLGYRGVVLADQPAGYWPLDAGALGQDVAPGAAHPGLVGTSVAPGPPGIRGGDSAVFPRLDDDAGRITIANTVGLRGDATTRALSVEAWIKANGVGSSLLPGPLMTVLGNEGPSGDGFGIRIRENGSIWFFIGGVGRERTRTLTAPDVVRSGQWFHYVGTYDGDTPRLYINGQLMPNLDGTPTYAPGAAVTSTGPLVLGGHVQGSEPFDGNLDEVAVYDRALSQADAARHYDAGLNGGPAVGDASVSAVPDHAAAGAEQIPVADLGTSSLAGGDPTTLVAAPLRSTPLRSTPLRSTPLRSTPLRSTPLRSTPLRSTPLSAIPLRSTPLRSTGWAGVLAGTPLADAPLNAVTLEQAFALNAPAVDALTLADIDLDSSPLRSTSLGALMLGDLTLRDLGIPAGGLCPVLGGSDPNCDEAALAGRTLAELEVAGQDLTRYHRLGLPLPAGGLEGTPLATIALRDIRLAATPLGAVPAAALDDILDCADPCTGTLGDASPAVLANATLGQVLARRPLPGLDSVSLASLLVGIVPAEELPLGLIPIGDLLRRAPLRTADLVTVTVGFTVDCTRADGLRVDVPVPDGLRFVPGSAKIAGGPDLADPQAVNGTLRFTTRRDGSALATICAGVTDTSSARQLRFEVEPPAKTGVLALQARVQVDAGAADATPGALTVDDGHDAPATTSGAPAIAPGVARTGYISAADDVDTYAVDAPARGSRVTVTLTHVPEDYDVAVLGPPTGLDAVPLRSTPLRSTPLRSTPLLDQGAEPGADPRNLAPQTLQDAPLRSTPLRSTPLRSTSMNRGRADESATFVVEGEDVGERFYVQVSGHNGVTSASPYLLTVRVTEPVPAPQCVNPRDLPTATPGALPATPLPAGTQTLFLVNRQRVAQLYSEQAAGDLLAELDGIAAMPQVSGAVVPVDGDADVRAAYAALEADRCSATAANHVAESINGVVDRLRQGLGGLRHIVLVGGDDVLPQVRVRDQVSVSNEREAADELVFGGRDNAVSRALRDGYVLTDDPYGDFDPQTWLSGQLFVPDVGLGRLVETPDEIIGQLEQFRTSGGVLDPQTAEVSGYDFLSDGAQEVLAQLRQAVPGATGDFSETWSAADAIASLNRPSAGFTSVNAHYDHYRALPASAFNSNGSPDLLSAAQATPQAGSVLFTMGCHAGLNVPDTAVGASTDRPDALLDWSQQLGRSRAVFVANTGYGYGDTEAVAWSERVMSLLAGQLASGKVTAGQALMFAKQRYMADTGVPGVYDAKATQEATFYGLPMYRIGTAGRQGAAVLPTEPGGGSVLRSARFAVDPVHDEIPSDRGTHWEVEGRAPQVSHFRPIQPRTDLDVTAADGLPVHGAIVDTLTSTDIGGVDPVYSRPTIDLAAKEPEISARSDVFPASIQRVASLGTPDGPRDRLVLVTGQFFTDPGSTTGRGTQRLFTHLAGEVLRSDSKDFDPPALRDAVGEVAGGVARFTVHSPDADAARGVVLYRDDSGDATWRRADLVAAGGGAFTASGPIGPSATQVTEFTLQLADGSGNVAVASNKGPGYVAAAAPPPSTPIAFSLTPPPPGGIYTTAPQVTVGDGTSTPQGYAYRIDDGEFVPYTGPFFLQGDGVRTVTIKAPDGQTARRIVQIDGTPPALADSAPAGWQRDPVTVDLAATDPPGGSGVADLTYTLAGAAPRTIQGDRETLTVEQEGVTSITYTATDRAGNESAPRTVDVKIDRSPPTAGHEISPAPRNGYNRGDVTVTITGEDAGSGVDALLITRDGAETEHPGRTAQVELTASGTLSYRARDTAGNLSDPREVTVRIDRAEPTAQHTVSPAAGESGWHRAPATVTITGADDGSGVAEIVYEATGAQRVEPTTIPGTSAAVTIAQDGITTLTYKAIDAAGNESDPQTVTLKVDRTPPALTCTPDRPYLWPPDLRLYQVNVAVGLSDPTSGPAGFTLVSVSSNGLLFLNALGFDVGTPDTAGWLRAIPTLLTFQPRTYTLTYEGRDVAGNTARCSAKVTVTKPPRTG